MSYFGVIDSCKKMGQVLYMHKTAELETTSLTGSLMHARVWDVHIDNDLGYSIKSYFNMLRIASRVMERNTKRLWKGEAFVSIRDISNDQGNSRFLFVNFEQQLVSNQVRLF